jgi:probable blue pigment (indigoidine) exporter
VSGTPSEPPSRGTSDLLLVVLLGVLWGSAFPVIRAGIVAGAPPLFFASVRYLLTAAAIVPIAILARSPVPRREVLLAPVLLGGLLMIGGYGALLYIGEESTSGGLAAVLTASAPLASAVIAYRLLPAERLGTFGVVGLLVGFGGVGVLVLPQLLASSGSGADGPVLVVAAVISFAAGSVVLRRTSQAAPGFWLLSMQFAVGGALVGVLGLVSREPLTLGNGSVVGPALAFLIVLTGIVGYTLYFRVHHSSGPTRANVVGYVNPVTGVLVGLVFFAETVTGIEIAGLLLIAGGLFLLQRDRRPAGAAPHSPAETIAVPPASNCPDTPPVDPR